MPPSQRPGAEEEEEESAGTLRTGRLLMGRGPGDVLLDGKGMLEPNDEGFFSM